jgi:hypothetical protein
VKQGGLPGSVLADDPDALAFGDTERDVVERHLMVDTSRGLVSDAEQPKDGAGDPREW